MIFKLGNFLGWLIIIAYIGTLLNYVTKAINKCWRKQISANMKMNSLMEILMNIFVKKHDYFGFATAAFLILHLLLQFLIFRISTTGLIAAVLLLFQVLLGLYASLRHRPRKGIWFTIHRTISFLLMIGIAFHLFLPFALSKVSFPIAKAEVSGSTDTPDNSTDTLRVFTLDELSQYNGKDGQPAYVAYNGIVYDVTNEPKWKGGSHSGKTAGTDLTNDIPRSPHGDSVFADLPVVGTLE